MRLKDGRSVQIRGKIDRVEERDGIIGITDYKTGAKGDEKKRNIDTLFMQGQDNAYLSYWRQLICYGWLYAQQEGHVDTEMAFSLLFALKGKVVSGEYKSASFLAQIMDVLEAIFDKEGDFSQDVRCQNCPYGVLCEHVEREIVVILFCQKDFDQSAAYCYVLGAQGDNHGSYP